jgi:iron complex outermembrane receptor protein
MQWIFAVSFLVSPCAVSPIVAQEIRTGIVEITVEESMGPVDGLFIRSAGNKTVGKTDASGKARLKLPTGPHALSLTRHGYAPKKVDVIVIADSTITLNVTVDMEEMPSMLEDVRVSATRTERLSGETAIRVEVLDEMEVDENTLMATSGITMLLNETPGLRVQAASPSLGTGSVRILDYRGNTR